MPELSLSHALVAYGLILSAYLYQGIIPSFNADDVIQVQSEDAGAHILTHGRWGGYLVYHVLLGGNPAPFMSTVIGLALGMWALWLVREQLGIRSAGAVLMYLVLSSVSIYYCELFSYDATRINTPIANLLAVAGLRLMCSRRKFAGVLLLAAAPAFYPAAIMLVATILVIMAIHELADSTVRRVVANTALRAALLAVAVFIYKGFTEYLYWASGLGLDSRTELDITAIYNNFNDSATYFLMHGIPFFTGMKTYYQSNGIVYASGCAVLGCAVSLTWAARRFNAIVVPIAFAFLLVAPICAVFVSATEKLGGRSLYAYALVHGWCLARWLETLMAGDLTSRARRGLLHGALTVGCALYVAQALQISQKSYDEYLATQTDLMATNRILYRIESVLAAHPAAPREDIPLAVLFERPLGRDPRGFPAGPRGDVGTARHDAWSREWIFRLIDPRFRPVTPEVHAVARELAAGHGDWPAADSVFYEREMIVVVISK